MIEETLLCSEPISIPLAQLIHQCTQGNPLFVSQFFQGLYRDGYISFDIESQKWQCDFSAMQLAVTNPNLLDYMVERLARFPAPTQELLKLAACIGFDFDIVMLAAIAQEDLEVVMAHLLPALQQGFLLYDNETCDLNSQRIECRFLHDQGHQATYSLVSKSEKLQIHHKFFLSALF